MSGETKVSERELFEKNSLQLLFNLQNFKIVELVHQKLIYDTLHRNSRLKNFQIRTF